MEEEGKVEWEEGNGGRSRNMMKSSRRRRRRRLKWNRKNVKKMIGKNFWFSAYLYWAIQVGLLTPLTFAQLHSSPLAAFISSVYFLHNGSR